MMPVSNMKLLPTVAAIALIAATAAYAQSGNAAPTNLSPSSQSQDIQKNAAPAAPSSSGISKGSVKARSTAHSRSVGHMSLVREDAVEHRITERLNRQQLNRPQTASPPNQ